MSEASVNPMVLVGQSAPDFTAPAVMPNNEINQTFNLKSYLEGSYGLVFFYPLDFTFVCPSEILAHDHRLKAFGERNTKVVAVSVDSHFTHLAWKNTPINNGGIGQVQYPLIADVKHEICRAYDVEFGAAGVAFRGSFLIDKKGVVRHQVVNDLPLGRNVDEMLRMVDALQFTEEHGEVCPAGWNKGKAGMRASTAGVAEYLAAHAKEL